MKTNSRPPFNLGPFSSAVVFFAAICILPNSQLQGADALRIIGWGEDYTK